MRAIDRHNAEAESDASDHAGDDFLLPHVEQALKALASALGDRNPEPDIVEWTLRPHYKHAVADHTTEFAFVRGSPKGTRPKTPSGYRLCIFGPLINCECHYSTAELAKVLQRASQS